MVIRFWNVLQKKEICEVLETTLDELKVTSLSQNTQDGKTL